MFKPENYFVRLLLLIIAIQGLLLAAGLQTKSFTADECYELRNLSLNPLTIANDGDGFPPLFRWLLSLSIALTGEPLSRSMPMLTSLMGTWVVAMTGKRIAGSSGGLAGGVFFALSACQLEYAQQLRAYSLYILTVACMLWAFFSLVHDWKTRHWIALVLFTSLALLAHYFAMLVALVLWGWLGFMVVRSRFARPGELRPKGCSIEKLLLAGISCALLSFPFLYSLKVDMAHPPPAEVVNPVDLTSIAYLYLSLAQGWCVGPSSIELQSLPFSDALLQIVPWAVLSFGASGCLLLVAFRSRKSLEKWLLLGLLTIPTLIAITLSYWLGFSFVSRYLACLIVPVALVVGVAFDRPSKPVAFVGLAILLMINGLSFYNRNWSSRYDRENYRAIVELISQSDESPRVLVLSHYISHALRKAAPEHWDIVPVRFYSDDPSDSVLSDIQMDPSRLEGAWVLAEWFPPDSELDEKREKELERLQATPFSRVCTNMELFHIKSINSEHTAEP
ncbi:MAG: glycosyltransferase family 39 protein [Pirellula sp.]|jgi:hypothetical protein|nr:glycosyltransferase family 39 protein [Pirellula sp.]